MSDRPQHTLRARWDGEGTDVAVECGFGDEGGDGREIDGGNDGGGVGFGGREL
jgi:hypothetical protein